MVGWREAVQTCGAVAKATPIGVKNGGQGGAEIGRESKMGKLQKKDWIGRALRL